MTYPTDPVILAGIWASAIATIGIWTYALYGENAFFRWAEHTFVATSTGIVIVTMASTLHSGLWAPLAKGAHAFLLLAVLGIIIYFRLHKKTAWISRWPIAVIIGLSTGIFMRGMIGEIVIQLRGTVLAVAGPFSPTAYHSFTNIVIIVAMITTASYFIFTREHKGALGTSAKVGRLFIMAMLGMYAGNIALLRLSTLLDRVIDVMKVFRLLPY